MTDIEKLSLERARKTNPNLNLLISRFDLDTSSISQADRISSQVQNRVDQWFSEFRQPAKPMDIITESEIPRIFWSEQMINDWIRKTNFQL